MHLSNKIRISTAGMQRERANAFDLQGCVGGAKSGSKPEAEVVSMSEDKEPKR